MYNSYRKVFTVKFIQPRCTDHLCKQDFVICDIKKQNQYTLECDACPCISSI